MTPDSPTSSLLDIVIVGGGPGGYTAGLYASRADMKTLLISGASTVSQITITDLLENYPGIPEGINGYDLMERFRSHATTFGLETLATDAIGLSRAADGSWLIETPTGTFTASAVILATGASWRKLGIPGEDTFAGRGVSSCATCDGPFYRNREVVVIGGGNTALQEALFLTHYASKVTLVHRRDRFRAEGVLQRRVAANGKIETVMESVPEAILGTNGVEAVRLRHVRTGETREIPAHGVFLFIGLLPNTDLVRDLLSLETDGAIPVSADMATAIPGLFACGDCTAKRLRQVVTACGDGATAAYAAQQYVEERKGMAYGS